MSFVCTIFTYCTKALCNWFRGLNEWGDSMSIRADIKSLLAESLIKLSKTRNIKHITVQDIVDNCGGGRQTFYNHFNDKYDLIMWIHNKQIEAIFADYGVNNNWYECLQKTYIMALENKHFYKNAFDPAGEQKYIFDITFKNMQVYINKTISKEFDNKIVPVNLCYVIDFYSYGQIETVIKWIKRGMKESPEFMADIAIICMPSELKKYLL